MSSGGRIFLKEMMLWALALVSVIVGFWYLNGHIGEFMQALNSESGEGVRQRESAEQYRPRRIYRQRRELTQDRRQAEDDGEDEDESGYGRVVLHANRSGHFDVNAYINNRRVELMADTGATRVVLTYADARHLGVTGALRFTGRARTANGVSRVAPIMLDSVQVGDIKLYHVAAIVAERGVLSTSLLGMSFIGRLNRFEMSGRRLVLEK